MKDLINNLLSQEVLLFLILIPIVASLTNIFRYFLGFKTLGIYPTIILSLAYYLAGARYGLFITIIVIISTLISHFIYKRIRMHYISRISLNYITISILLGVFFLTSTNTTFLNLGIDFYKMNPIAIVLIATTSEYFLKLYIKKDLFSTFLAFGETISVSIIGWFLIRNGITSNFLTSNIWILAILIAMNLVIGKSLRLRVLDYFRFKQILQEPKSENKSSKK